MRQPQASIWRSNHTFAGKLLRLPLRLIPHDAEVKVLTGVNKGSTWVVGAGVHHCWLGTYEREKQAAIVDKVRSGMTAWDVGANVGFYTLAFSRLVGSSGRVVAFEPNGLNAAYLVRHIRANACQNVDVVQAAVSESVGLVAFSSDKGGSVGSISDRSFYNVPSVSLDSFLQRVVTAPDLLKIDVEGAEAAVLRGAKNLLTSHSPEIWLALHGAAEMRDCTGLLKQYGYSIYNLEGVALDAIDSYEIVARKAPANG